MRASVRQYVPWILLFLIGAPYGALCQGAFFNYSKYLTGPPSTLSVWIESVNRTTGAASVNGVDMGALAGPFEWLWGDGTSEFSWFPATHTYTDLTQNYHLRVISHYDGGGHDTADAVMHFVPPSIAPVALPAMTAAFVPASMIPLGTRLYDPPAELVPFDDSFFPAVPRSTVEYILSIAAAKEMDFTNDNVYLYNGKFEQYMFRDPAFSGAYSLWFLDPVCFGAGDDFIGERIGYSSLFHEMGHNFSLNTPPVYSFGGNTDGPASSILTESVAQIYQHAAGFEIINGYLALGLPEDVMVDIRQDVVNTIKNVRVFYEQYVSAGMPYTSWDVEGTPENEAFGTFMTIAYKFCEHAESAGEGYRQPLKRMMTLLQLFDADLGARYAKNDNTAEADIFRSTLMVTALSFAFESDLRAEFRALNFPVDDATYTELYTKAVPVELVRFEASVMQQDVVLCWKTATEVNNYGFEIERSLKVEGSGASCVWTKIGFVEGRGTSNVPTTYSFSDHGLRGGSYAYRLRQIDRDGRFTYSEPVECTLRLDAGEYALSRNYPNPFNPMTELTFALQTPGRARLAVYNMLGEEVATLFDRQTEAGRLYRVAFDGSRFASGVYLAVLRASGRYEVRKMTLMK
ncbi:MAG: T9SS type A sorting domain-containing protein [Acidobacteriota bacterium]